MEHLEKDILIKWKITLSRPRKRIEIDDDNDDDSDDKDEDDKMNRDLIHYLEGQLDNFSIELYIMYLTLCKTFKYLGSSLTNPNSIHKEIKT